MDYDTALHMVLSLADLERMTGPSQGRPRMDLSRMEAILARAGRPHLRVPAVHVTGTKGKGSTAAMVASALAGCGYRVGLYTSPHLHTMRERIQIDGAPVGEQAFADAVERLWPLAQGAASGDLGRVTTFELLTAMAFSLFAEAPVDLQVLEVGLGGTLDATNVVERPLACVVTSISLDHTAVLGDTVEAIARDKAGIIKPGATAVTAPQAPGVEAVLEQACRERGARLVRVGREYRWAREGHDLTGQHLTVDGPPGRRRLWIPLLGEHQLENAACALAALDAVAAAGFPLPPEGLERGFRSVRWPGRLEVLQGSPLVVVDGAHNPYSMGRLVEAVRYHFPGRRCILVFGSTRGHDLEGMVREAAALAPVQALACRSRHPRSVAPEALVEALGHAAVPARAAGPVAEAMDAAMAEARPGDLVLATGSLFVVAEARERLLGLPAEEYPEFQPASDPGTSDRVR